MIRIKNGIFLHIPKTGGTWLRKYFEEAGMVISQTELAHTNGSQIEDQSQHEVVFCFVRHPLTWLRSYWQCKQYIPDRRGGDIDTIVDQPFWKFIDCFISLMPGFISSFFAGYTEYSHFVGKQETLREDLVNLFRYARIPYDRGLLFGKPNENVILSNERYTVDQALKIMELEKEMVDKYDYNYLPMRLIDND